MQGDCATEPPAAALGSRALPQRRPRQCVLTHAAHDGTLLTLQSDALAATGVNLLLDNFVLTTNPLPLASSAGWQRSVQRTYISLTDNVGDTASVRLWLRNVHFQGPNGADNITYAGVITGVAMPQGGHVCAEGAAPLVTSLLAGLRMHESVVSTLIQRPTVGHSC